MNEHEKCVVTVDIEDIENILRGVCNGEGKNVLGKLLMDIRKELREDACK